MCGYVLIRKYVKMYRRNKSEVVYPFIKLYVTGYTKKGLIYTQL